MSAIEFIAFAVMMVASVILSFKRKQEKEESLEQFEKAEPAEEEVDEPPLVVTKQPLMEPHFDPHQVKKKEEKEKEYDWRAGIIMQEILNKPKGWQ